jgi:outer membrane receptor for ferrienterochelin and colicins
MKISPLVLLLSSGMACATPEANPEPAPLLQEVVVTGKASADETHRQAISQKQIIERQDIANMGALTVGEVLGKLPGVELGATNSDGSSSQRARGMSRDSVQILLDGERPNGGSRIAASVLGRLPAEDLERVEILRGSSAEFGGAASVTVNLVLKKARAKKSIAVKSTLGMVGSEPTGAFNLTQTGGADNFSWSVPLTLNLSRRPFASSTDRQTLTAGARSFWQQDNSQGVFTFRELSSSPRLNWRDGADTLTVSPTVFDGRGGSKTNALQTAYANPASGTGLAFNGDSQTQLDMHMLMLRVRVEGEKNLAAGKLSSRVALSDGQRDMITQRTVHNAAQVLSSNSDVLQSHEQQFNGALRWDTPLDNHLLAMSGEFSRVVRREAQTLTGNFAGSNASQAGQTESVMWLQDDWSLSPKTTLTGGLRGEQIQLNSTSVNQTYRRALPSVAVRFEPAEQWVMRSSLGAGIKPPKLEELTAITSHSQIANTPLDADKSGNAALQAEHSVNFEAVLERYLAADAGVLGANFYLRNTQNFTEQRVQLEAARWVSRPYNEGTARHTGVELDGKLRTEKLGINGGTVKAHLVLPKAVVQDSRLGISRTARDTPDFVFSSGWEQSLSAAQASYGMTLQVSGRSVSNIPNEQVSATQARATLDAFYLQRLNAQFNLRISGGNLTAAKTARSSTYSNAGNSWTMSSVDKGVRSVMIGLEGRI